MLTESKFTQPEVLKVTRLKPSVLQTWMNRGAIALTDQNPGTGRRRLYSACDVVKLAIMRRMADLSVDLSISKKIAEAAVDELIKKGQMDWNQFIFLRPKTATEEKISFQMFGSSPLMEFSPTIGDAQHMRLAQFVEPFEGIGIFDRRDRVSFSDERPINPARREMAARAGIHAEPVIVFPLGEVVNGALQQLAALTVYGPGT